MADENMNLGVGMAAAENKLESDEARVQRAAEALESATAKMGEDYRDKRTNMPDGGPSTAAGSMPSISQRNRRSSDIDHTHFDSSRS